MSSPSQDVDEDSVADQHGHHGASGLGVHGPQQQHHGDQAAHGDLCEHSSSYLTVWLQQIERTPVGLVVLLSTGHYLLE